jgi:hypothetical protein
LSRYSHTAKRIFERLRDEHGYAGSLTTVTYYVREQKRQDLTPNSTADSTRQCNMLVIA